MAISLPRVFSVSYVSVIKVKSHQRVKTNRRNARTLLSVGRAFDGDSEKSGIST